jgi:glycosyltransferase involved in cell wall biosynthesis
MGQPLVSVIIPCMNEEKTLGSCIGKAWQALEREGLEGEIIVADNSTDSSGAIAKSMGATVIIPQKKGYGNAYLEGLQQARGRFFILADADDTYDLNEMPKFLAPLLTRDADFVIGRG